MAPPALIPLLCALAVGNVEVRAGAALAGGVRRTSVGGEDPVDVGEAEVNPSLAVVRQGPVALSLSYLPRLTLPVDVAGGAPELTSGSALERRLYVLHRVDLAAGVDLPRWRVSLAADGSAGDTDLTRFEVLEGQAIPTTSRIPVAAGGFSLSASWKATRRTSWSFLAGASISGGADTAAREVLPLQRGARLGGSVSWGASRVDAVSAAVSATASQVESGGDALFLRSSAGWRRQLGRSLSTGFSAGGAAAWLREPGSGTTSGAAPWAEATLQYLPGRLRPTLETRIAVEPSIDRVTGAVDVRAAAEGSTGFRPSPRWTLEARAGTAVLRRWRGFDLFAGDDPSTYVSTGTLGAGFRVHEAVILSARAYFALQRGGGPDVPAFREAGAFLGLAVALLNQR